MKRYFFISTIAINPWKESIVSNFDLVTENDFPTMRKCIEISENKNPTLKNTMILSISEISEIDFIKFTSEQ